MQKIEITAQNIEAMRETLPCDMGAALEIGAIAWRHDHNGWMMIIPDAGRGCVEYGANSAWGDWYEEKGLLLLDDRDPVIWVDAAGAEIVDHQ